jgi:hypothetical protein
MRSDEFKVIEIVSAREREKLIGKAKVFC